jgi:hypothetical protein
MDLVAHQSKSLKFERGLFLIKYESADDETHPPRILIEPQPGAEGLEFILPPGASDAVLWSPGASMVIRAMKEGHVEVSVAPARRNGSQAARVQLVPLSTDPDGLAELSATAAALDLSSFKVLAHVAGIGDLVVGPDEWAAGPKAPSRIEGIALQWPNRPRTIDLRYAVRVGGQKPETKNAVAGQFAGTRGRALPLVGATLEISGAESGAHQLKVDALFLGSPRMTVAGRRVVLAGPTGREPLVGLRVRLEPVDGATAYEAFASKDDKRKPAKVVAEKARMAHTEEEMPSTDVAANPKASASIKPNRDVRVFRRQPKAEIEPAPVSKPAAVSNKRKSNVRVFHER